MEEEDLNLNKLPSFTSAQDEIEFWKSKAFILKKGRDELRKEYEEYQDDSKLLENELDSQLKQNELKIVDLNSCVNRLTNDNENLRSRLEQMHAEHSAQMAEWTAEVSSFRKAGDDVNKLVRQLEQRNDDLERANRAAAVSIEDFETKLNHAIERNAFLESELDEKENLKTMVQRLKDETRDLRYELQVTKKEPEKVQDSNKIEATTPTIPFSSNHMSKEQKAALGIAASTSSRLSPLSIVNDLLRKVGALETKLATYHRKDDGSIKKSGRSNESKNHQNKSKLPRGVSSSSVQEIIKT